MNGRGVSRPKAFITFGIVFIATEHFKLRSAQDLMQKEFTGKVLTSLFNVKDRLPSLE